MAGSIGSISISVPLASLRSKPTVITVDEIYLLVSPWYAGKPVPSLVIAAALAKNALLRTIEQHYISAKLGGGSAGAGSKSSTAASASEDSKLFEGLLGTIIANLQVRRGGARCMIQHPDAHLTDLFRSASHACTCDTNTLSLSCPRRAAEGSTRCGFVEARALCFE